MKVQEMLTTVEMTDRSWLASGEESPMVDIEIDPSTLSFDQRKAISEIMDEDNVLIDPNTDKALVVDGDDLDALLKELRV